jgi:hypothetical protein
MRRKEQFSVQDLETMLTENVKELEDLLIAKLLLVLASTAIFGYGPRDTLKHILLSDATEAL